MAAATARLNPRALHWDAIQQFQLALCDRIASWQQTSLAAFETCITATVTNLSTEQAYQTSRAQISMIGEAVKAEIMTRRLKFSVILLMDGLADDNDGIQVASGYGSMSLSHWLDKNCIDLTAGPSSMETQSAWWMANNGSFPLLRLPMEVRESIYLASCGWVIQPGAAKRTVSDNRNSGFKNILLANKQIYEECRSTIYNYATWLFTRQIHIHRSLKDPHLSLRNVRRIELSFSHCDFMKFFGWELHDNSSRWAQLPSMASFVEAIEREKQLWGNLDAWELRKMDLRCLVINLPHPNRVEGELSRPRSSGCHSDTIKMILNHAWPMINGLPINLTGYIREKDKVVWQEHAKEALKRRLSWENRRAELGLPRGDGDDGWDDNDDTERNHAEEIQQGGVEIKEVVENNRGFKPRPKKARPWTMSFIPAFISQWKDDPVCKCEEKCDKMDSWVPIESKEGVTSYPRLFSTSRTQ